VIKQYPLEALHSINQHAGRMAMSSIMLAELQHDAKKSNAQEGSLAVVSASMSSILIASSAIITGYRA
jgi:tRNA(fMet)-specific endonuclease VapC